MNTGSMFEAGLLTVGVKNKRGSGKGSGPLDQFVSADAKDAGNFGVKVNALMASRCEINYHPVTCPHTRTHMLIHINISQKFVRNFLKV